MNDEEWVAAVGQLRRPAVRAALVVQCGLDWLRDHRLGLRNAIDEALISVQLARGGSLRITRVLLHNLPATASDGPDGDVIARSFAEWNHRLAASAAMLSAPSPRVERIIVDGAAGGDVLPDMVDVLEDGRWCDAPRTDQVMQVIRTPGATTPLTTYDVNLSGPFSDTDPSVHM